MPIRRSRSLLPMLAVLALLGAGLVLPTTADEPRKEPAGVLSLNLRSRVELFKGSGVWDEVTVHKDLPARETAVILCDVWDNHWCKSAAGRCDALARRMVPVLAALRSRGVQVIHAPSECMDFYKDTPQRKRIQQTARV